MEEVIKSGVALIATTGVTKIVESIVNTYIKPKFEKMYKKSLNSKQIELISEKLRCYIERSYSNCLTMNTIVFKNEQKKLNDLYIPLTVIKKNELEQKEEKISICIDRYRDDFIPKYKKILLVDTAGMGKSTIIKYLFLSSITEEKGIPILIELRRLDKDNSIMDHIMNEINDIREQFRKEDVLELIEGGDFIFFFDGYDEIAPESKEIVTKNLQDFISKSDNNKFIISSRDENELCSFGSFQRFDIKPLTKEEAYLLIKKYDNNGDLSKELISKLETEENLKLIEEFLDNPLMVSLLYKAFDYKRTIPYKKHIFYRQVYDALFEEHDLSKPGTYNRNKKSKLDIDSFHRILRTIGFVSLSKGIIYSKEEFIDLIKQANKKNNDLNINVSNLVYDLTHSVPVFVKEGVKYRWAHKSFQEYFAASYIYYDCKEQNEALLKKIIQKDNIRKYYNILDFYYDIDYKGFKRSILYPIIDEFIESFRKSYSRKEYSLYNIEEINLRKSLQFNYDRIDIKKIDKDDMEGFKRDGFQYFNNTFNTTYTKASLTNNELSIFLDEKNICTILSLLYSKKSNLVKVESQEFQRPQIINKMVEELDYEVYTVDEKLENNINKISIFNLVNKYILSVGKDLRHNKSIILDYKLCVKLKEEIEQEISSEKNDIDFI
ncbi:MAG: hypothetical protein SO128_12390 [Clostridium cadaveris]|uniref:NACHT domain-containing protein n=1 Tax=Clostridium cadaveris TaxID=1529 RepID=UPI002A875FFB|nr:hypothetical protein [Clostridium cadaveris]